MKRIASAVVALGFVGTSCTSCKGSHAPTESILLEDLDGVRVNALDTRGADALVVLFSGVECPIARAYSPELASIAAEYAPRIAVNIALVDRDLTQNAARRHATEFDLPGQIVLDREHRLVHRLGATTTPEAFVVLANGEIVYSGRIDDRFASLARQQRTPRTRELRDALDAVLAGRTPQCRRSEPIGCFIE